MPPTLRSAQSSPTTRSGVGNISPNLTPGRKSPRCTKCGRLRQGHPRSGCPYSNDSETSPSKTKPKTKSLQETLSDAFGSMYLEPLPPPDEDEGKRNAAGSSFPDRINESIRTISMDAEESPKDLVKPSFSSQATTVEDLTASAPLKVRLKSGPRTLMPGTLIAPSWESTIGSFSQMNDNTESPKMQAAEKKSLAVQTSFDFSVGAEPSPSGSLIPPSSLHRSLSMEQRNRFFSSLSQTSPASVYIYRKNDMEELDSTARALGLYIRVIDNGKDKSGEEQVLLVIGTDLRSVEKLAEELRKSIKPAGIETPGTHTTTTTTNIIITTTTDDRSSSSAAKTLKAVAGGAIVGAVGTWAGLAFS